MCVPSHPRPQSARPVTLEQAIWRCIHPNQLSPYQQQQEQQRQQQRQQQQETQEKEKQEKQQRSRSAAAGATATATTSNSASTTTKRKHAKIIVQHHYNDRSTEGPPENVKMQDLLDLKASSSAPFPIKLFEMLEVVEQEGLEHLISWQHHGRCFLIHKPKEFTQELLPRFFKLSKLQSFQRQLNLYGFGRITQGKDKGGYYHEFFLRGKLYHACRIARHKVKGTGVRGCSNPSQEPNFWKMTFVGAPATTPATQKIQQDQDPVVPDQHMIKSNSSGFCHHRSFSSLSAPLSGSSSKITNYKSFAVCLLDDSEDDVLVEWGMPFHALDVLALDLNKERKNNIDSSSQERAAAASMPTAPNGDDDDDLEFDSMVLQALSSVTDISNTNRNSGAGDSATKQIESFNEEQESYQPLSLSEDESCHDVSMMDQDLANALEQIVSSA